MALEKLERTPDGMIRRVDSSVSPRDIERLSATNPTVRACWALWQQGDCSFEQAMMQAVAALAKQTDELQKHLAGCLKRLPPSLPPRAPSP